MGPNSIQMYWRLFKFKARNKLWSPCITAVLNWCKIGLNGLDSIRLWNFRKIFWLTHDRRDIKSENLIGSIIRASANFLKKLILLDFKTLTCVSTWLLSILSGGEVVCRFNFIYQNKRILLRETTYEMRMSDFNTLDTYVLIQWIDSL